MPSVRTLVASAVVSSLCVAAGCTTSDNRPAEPPSASAADPASPTRQQVDLRFAVYGDPPLLDAYAELAEAFERRNPQVDVEVTTAPNAARALGELRAGFGEPTSPDVFLADRKWLPSLLAGARVRPVDVLLEERGLDFGDRYQRDGLEAFSADSALQCMPHDVSPVVVYYNQRLVNPARLVEEPGDDPPTARTGWSFEQFSRAARQASRGPALGVHLDPDLETLAPFIWSGGGDLVDDQEAPTSLTLSEGDTRAALERVLTLVRDPDVTPTSRQLSWPAAVNRFKRGKLAMIFGTRALTPELRDAPRLDFEAFPLPSLGGYSTISTVNGYCISTQSDHVGAAADFIAFAVGRVGARITSRSGYVVPSNVEVAQSRAFKQPARQPKNAFLFSTGTRLADEVPLVAPWPRVVQTTRPLLKEMFYAPVINLDSLLAQADRRSQTILAPAVPPEEN